MMSQEELHKTEMSQTGGNQMEAYDKIMLMKNWEDYELIV